MKKKEIVIEDVWNDEKIALVKNYIKSSRKKLSPNEKLKVELLSIKYRIKEISDKWLSRK